jgi:hypothetical protein
MANGFFLNETASVEIGAERRRVRHSSNSSITTGQISAIDPRLFRNTKPEVGLPTSSLAIVCGPQTG